MGRNTGKDSKYVECRVCDNEIGRRGIAAHSGKHKREFLEKKGIEKGWKETDFTYDDVVEFFNPENLDKSYSSRDKEIVANQSHATLDSFNGKTTD